MEQLEIEGFLDKVANRIKQLRGEQGFTQLDLSTKSGVDERQIQRLENRQTSPTLKTLYKVTKGLDVDLHTFFNFQSLQKNKK